MSVEYRVCDVFDGLADLEDGSIDLIVTSPPFLALRSYLPADHPDKGKEIGSERTPAEFLDVMLRLSAEFRRVLAPHGSLCVELGDTYAGSGGAGGDYAENGWREGQNGFRQVLGDGWPLAKSKTLIPQLFEVALAYGFNPLTSEESPAGKWRVRNVVTWARPNPPVGALGDKWRPATSDVVVACTSDKRFWDDLATRRPHIKGHDDGSPNGPKAATPSDVHGRGTYGFTERTTNTAGAPLLDYWVIPPGGYPGSHYAVYPPELVVPLVKAMCPGRVCRTCGEPSRRVLRRSDFRARVAELGQHLAARRAAAGVTRAEMVPWFTGYKNADSLKAQVSNWELGKNIPSSADWSVLKARLGDLDDFDDLVNAAVSFVEYEDVSDYPSGWTQDANGQVYQRLDSRKNRIHPEEQWSDCGHNDWRTGRVLDPFAGSGTTLMVAHGHGFDAVGFDLDERNLELARERVGPMFFQELV